MEITIGQYADYFNYDPDGLFGKPTPRDPQLEDVLFGTMVMEMYRNRKESNA